MMRYLAPIAWIWLIIIGGLMITPGGVECIVCGAVLTRIIGLLSVILGAAALITSQRLAQR